ncbi:Interferon developmental regulator [Fasciolopsis buskii]|uniref:Interferon developmental regulator n=1 Tax=Fasciolopsis buskii TaxID=27845 RepID=A0A8E0RRX0_9TREM|nr:Interferon developmental regulator [Fasciolopsis buski]
MIRLVGFFYRQVDDTAVLQCLLDRVNTASEALTEKRPDTRVKALTFLINSFRSNYLCLDDTWNYISTFIDGIEHVLKKGKTLDQTLAVECLAVFCLQCDCNITEWLVKFFPILDTVLRDNSASCSFRSACATTLAVLQLLAGSCDLVSPVEIMKTFEVVFRGSCLKGDGKAPSLDPAVEALHVASLRAWGLLYTFLTEIDVGPIGKALLPTINSLLQGNNVDMRIMAGETAALIYERIRNEVDERYRGPTYTDLVRLLNTLATDGTKSRSKIDRKRQRHSFRDILDAVTQSDLTETSVNLGSEVLVLSSCEEHFCYDILCTLLKGGLIRHLQQNYQVREIFGLGAPISVASSMLDRRSAKNQRRLANSYAFKIRTQKLSSRRDRRATVTADYD